MLLKKIYVGDRLDRDCSLNKKFVGKKHLMEMKLNIKVLPFSAEHKMARKFAQNLIIWLFQYYIQKTVKFLEFGLKKFLRNT